MASPSSLSGWHLGMQTLWQEGDSRLSRSNHLYSVSILAEGLPASVTYCQPQGHMVSGLSSLQPGGAANWAEKDMANQESISHEGCQAHSA